MNIIKNMNNDDSIDDCSRSQSNSLSTFHFDVSDDEIDEQF